MLGRRGLLPAGSLLFGTEYFFQWADAPEAGDPIFHGGDVVAAWLLTGETRAYNTRGGSSKPCPRRGPCSRAARAPGRRSCGSPTSTSTAATSRAASSGGSPRMVNWHLSDNVRLELAYGYGKLDRFDLRAPRSSSRAASSCSSDAAFSPILVKDDPHEQDPSGQLSTWPWPPLGPSLLCPPYCAGPGLPGHSHGPERDVRQVPEPAGRQERRLHPGAGQGRPQDLRHRAGDHRREGLHRGRRQVRGLDPVDLQGLHHGQGDRGAGARGTSRRPSAWTRPACASTPSSRSSSRRRRWAGRR